MALSLPRKISALVEHIPNTVIDATNAATNTIDQARVTSLTADLAARTVRAANETVTGNWTYTNPVTIPDGTIAQHAVSLAQLNNVAAGFNARLHTPVQDLAGLKAITDYEDKQGVLVEDLGTQYRFDEQATTASDDNGVVRPTDIASDATPGRWIKQFVQAVDAVTLNTAQSIVAVKTFTVSPLVPVPTTDGQAANKEYVDDAVAAATAKEWRTVYIDAATAGTTTLAKNGGDPAIIDDNTVRLFVNGVLWRKGPDRQYTVTVGGASLTCIALPEDSDIEIQYLA